MASNMLRAFRSCNWFKIFSAVSFSRAKKREQNHSHPRHKDVLRVDELEHSAIAQNPAAFALEKRLLFDQLRRHSCFLVKELPQDALGGRTGYQARQLSCSGFRIFSAVSFRQKATKREQNHSHRCPAYRPPFGLWRCRARPGPAARCPPPKPNGGSLLSFGFASLEGQCWENAVSPLYSS